MRHLFCLVGLHQRREVLRLQLGDEFLHRGWVCDRDGCQARVLAPGFPVPQYDVKNPTVARAVQAGIKAMRKERQQ